MTHDDVVALPTLWEECSVETVSKAPPVRLLPNRCHPGSSALSARPTHTLPSFQGTPTSGVPKALPAPRPLLVTPETPPHLRAWIPLNSLFVLACVGLFLGNHTQLLQVQGLQNETSSVLLRVGGSVIRSPASWCL